MLYAQKKNYFKEKGINTSFTQSIFFFNTVGIPSQLYSSPTWTSTGPKKDFPQKGIPSCANTLNNLLPLPDLVLATQHYYPHHRGLITSHKTTSTTNPKVLGLTFT